MILDNNLCFDPAGTALTVTAASTNVLDLGIVNGIGGNARDLGVGDEPALKLLMLSSGTFTSSGSTGTLQIDFQGAPDNGSGAPGTWTTYASSGALSQATINSYVGSVATGVKLFPIDVPHREAGAALPRYYRLNYTVASGPFTAGTVEAFIVIGRDDATAYPNNYSTAGIN